MSILVVGSLIMDCVATTNRAPLAGETIVGLSYNTYFGGKGANQAFAASRMGSKVEFSGCVGNDDFGKRFITLINDEGFCTDYLKISKDNSTGVSLVTVETSGQNRICMVPGANMDYNVEDLALLKDIIKESNVIVTQCEMQYSIVEGLAKYCKEYNKKFILNPAPARHITDLVLQNTYIITPNETELGVIIDRKLETIEDYISGAKELLSRGVENVIVTLGDKGSLLVNKKIAKIFEPYKVKAVDTVGAGDSFTGSLAAMIDQGFDIEDAIKYATAVAALEIQKKGAIPSIPYRKDVEEFINKQK